MTPRKNKNMYSHLMAEETELLRVRKLPREHPHEECRVAIELCPLSLAIPGSTLSCQEWPVLSSDQISFTAAGDQLDP